MEEEKEKEAAAESFGVSAGAEGLFASAVVAAVTFTAVDVAWLGFIARDLYVE